MGRLYVNESSECKKAMALLEKAEIGFKEINIERLDLQAYIWKDLGTNHLPVLATSENMFLGLEQITEFANNGKE